MKRNRIYDKWLPAAALCLAALMAGCVAEKDNLPVPGGKTNANGVLITVSVPAPQTPSTRSIESDKGEAAVQSVDVLVFDDSTPIAKLLQHVQATNINKINDPEGKEYKVQFRAALTTNASARTLAIVANASTEVTSAVSAAGGAGTATKAGVLANLTYVTGAGAKWNANPSNVSNPIAGTNYTAIPMYGEKALTTSGITSGMTIAGDIELTRMLARIDVVNSATPDFTLSKVHVVNYQTKGYIAPAWDASGSMLAALPGSPMIPDAASSKALGEANALEYTYAVGGLTGEIYIHEATIKMR